MSLTRRQFLTASGTVGAGLFFSLPFFKPASASPNAWDGVSPIRVSTIEELRAAVRDANPGATIVIADGVEIQGHVPIENKHDLKIESESYYNRHSEEAPYKENVTYMHPVLIPGLTKDPSRGSVFDIRNSSDISIRGITLGYRGAIMAENGVTTSQLALVDAGDLNNARIKFERCEFILSPKELTGYTLQQVANDSSKDSQIAKAQMLVLGGDAHQVLGCRFLGGGFELAESAHEQDRSFNRGLPTYMVKAWPSMSGAAPQYAIHYKGGKDGSAASQFVGNIIYDIAHDGIHVEGEGNATISSNIISFCGQNAVSLNRAGNASNAKQRIIVYKNEMSCHGHNAIRIENRHPSAASQEVTLFDNFICMQEHDGRPSTGIAMRAPGQVIATQNQISAPVQLALTEPRLTGDPFYNIEKNTYGYWKTFDILGPDSRTQGKFILDDLTFDHFTEWAKNVPNNQTATVTDGGKMQALDLHTNSLSEKRGSRSMQKG